MDGPPHQQFTRNSPSDHCRRAADGRFCPVRPSSLPNTRSSWPAPPMLGTPIHRPLRAAFDAFHPRSLDTLGHILSVYPDAREAVLTLRRTANDHRLLRPPSHEGLCSSSRLGPGPTRPTISFNPARAQSNLLWASSWAHSTTMAAAPLSCVIHLLPGLPRPLDLLLLRVLGARRSPYTALLTSCASLALQPDHDLQMGVLDARQHRHSPRSQGAQSPRTYSLLEETAHAANRHLQKLLLERCWR